MSLIPFYKASCLSLSIPTAIKLFGALLTCCLSCQLSLLNVPASGCFPIACIHSASLVFITELVETLLLITRIPFHSITREDHSASTQAPPVTGNLKVPRLLVSLLDSRCSIRKLFVMFNQNVCPFNCSYCGNTKHVFLLHLLIQLASIQVPIYVPGHQLIIRGVFFVFCFHFIFKAMKCGYYYFCFTDEEAEFQ